MHEWRDAHVTTGPGVPGGHGGRGLGLAVDQSVPSCNGDPVLDEIAEEPDVVRLRVVSTVTNPGDACLDSLEVELDEPLGDRDLIDMTSGAQIHVRSRP